MNLAVTVPQQRNPRGRPRAGVVSLTRLDLPTRHDRAPLAEVQGTLALDLEHALLPRRRHLTVVPGTRDDLERFAHRFAQVVVDVLGGDRSVQQLLHWTAPDVYADMVRRTTLLHRVTGTDQRVRRLRATVRSVRLFFPTPEAAEISVHVRQGQRSRALAARIDLEETGWICTALELG